MLWARRGRCRVRVYSVGRSGAVHRHMLRPVYRVEVLVGRAREALAGSGELGRGPRRAPAREDHVAVLVLNLPGHLAAPEPAPAFDGELGRARREADRLLARVAPTRW